MRSIHSHARNSFQCLTTRCQVLDQKKKREKIQCWCPCPLLTTAPRKHWHGSIYSQTEWSESFESSQQRIIIKLYFCSSPLLLFYPSVYLPGPALILFLLKGVSCAPVISLGVNADLTLQNQWKSKKQKHRPVELRSYRKGQWLPFQILNSQGIL